ncbi:hypothetical protein V9K67_17680 [Paraflavisolibacter sp. H34]|uniref:hypothetical protein n=1 Tax=Huijunlia imazamoxiresistens TaxID=3127457 RepID=UPI00301B3213
MEMWTPITLEELESMMARHQAEMDSKQLRLWSLIRTPPVKWSEDEYGNEGGGFWVVGLFGNYVLWYNDIEEGFNIGTYTVYGKIDEYACEQYHLNHSVNQIYWLIEAGIYPSFPKEKLLGD